MKKPALGRGLSALIPSVRPVETVSRGGPEEIEIDRLEPNRRQPRRRFDEEGLTELADSIRESGILQPILVSRDGERLRILAGERRVRAARLAGLAKVPVLYREGLSDRDHLLLALVENVQRKDLTALEEAEAYRSLRDEFQLTQDEVAARVGKDRATVANALRLLKLPAAVREALDDGSLSAGHARALLPLPSAEDQEKLAREIVRAGLSVRTAEARVAAILGRTGHEVKKAAPRDANTRDAELRMQRALATKVEIKRRRRGGEIRITFHSEQELIGLFERIVREEP